MLSHRKIEQFNGPLDGRLQDIEAGVPRDEVGIPDDRDPKLFHYYRVCRGSGVFLRSEREKDRWPPYRGLN